VSDEDEAPALVSRNTIGAASCLTTILALPIMFGLLVVVYYLINPVPLNLAEIAGWVIALPLVMLLGLFGAFFWPWSTAAALALTTVATFVITRRRGGKA
jgi:hypothetical protein